MVGARPPRTHGAIARTASTSETEDDVPSNDSLLDPHIAARADVVAAYESITSQLASESTDPPDFVSLLRQVMNNYDDADIDAALRYVAVEAVDADGVSAQYFVPRGADLDRRIVYLHGGGWLAGSLASYRALAAILATAARTPVLLVDYALAPENRYPAGLNDADRALGWAWEHGPGGNGKAGSVMLAGDSAGGNLAAALTIRLIQQQRRLPSTLGLVSAAVDVGPGFTAVYDPIGGGDAMAGLLQFYTDVPDPLSDPCINPSAAGDAVIAQFPPTLVQASSDETLLKPAVDLAGRLIGSRVRTQLSVWPLMPHIWQNFLGSLPEAKLALDELGRFSRQ